MLPLASLSLLLALRAGATNTPTSTLFEGGTVIAFDAATESFDVKYDASVLVTGDRIAKILSAGDTSAPADAERVSVVGKILVPGFVDTHRHGWQTAYKTMASNTSLAEYFSRYSAFSGVGDLFAPEDMFVGQAAGLYEAINSGVTSIIDHAHGTFSAAQVEGAFNASLESGARMWFCYGFEPRPGGFDVPDQMAHWRRLALDPRLEGSLLGLGVAYDYFEVSPPEQVASVVDLLKTSNVSALTVHHLGGPWMYSNSPVALNRLGAMTNETAYPIVFSHATYITPQDAQLLRQFNKYISITPESEMHYGHGHLFAPFVQDQASIGIDTHTTFSSDLIGQARIWLQSVRRRLFQEALDHWKVPRNNPMSAAQALYLITRAGGRALHRDDIGVIAEGAAADLLVINGRSLNMLGWNDPIAAVVLHSHVGDIEHVMIGGKWRKRDYKLITVDGQNQTDIEERFLASAKRIQDGLKAIPPTVLEGEYAPGIPFVTLENMDVVRGPANGY